MRTRWLVALAALLAGGLALWRLRAPVAPPAAPAAGGSAAGRSSPATPFASGGGAGRSAEERRAARARYEELGRRIQAAQAAERRRTAAAAAAPTPAAAATGQGAPTGTLDREYIRGRIREITPLLKECYDLARAGRPSLSGRLTVRFEVAGEPGLGGLVERAEIVRAGRDAGADEAVDATLDECVRATVESVTFEPPTGGGRVTVTYPFIFRSDDPPP